MDWASGADRHQKTALQKVRAFFLERGGRGESARAAHARSAALVAISNRRGGGGENWVGVVCPQKLIFVGFFGKPIFSRILRPFSRFIGSGPTPSPGISRAKGNAYPVIQILVPPAQRPSPPPGKPVTKPEKKEYAILGICSALRQGNPRASWIEFATLKAPIGFSRHFRHPLY